MSAPHRILGILAMLPGMFLLRNRIAQYLMLPGMVLAVAPFPPVLHSLAAPLLFGPALALAIPAIPMTTPISTGLKRIIAAAPPLVFLQMVLGAAYRHKAIGVVWHLVGAMTVAAVLLIACVLLLRQIPLEKAPRRAAGLLNAMLVIQVTLGMAALLLRMLDANAAHLATAYLATAYLAAAHVTGGSLTFAASLVLFRATQRR